MSQYNVPDKATGETWSAAEHNMLKFAHNDTDARVTQSEADITALQASQAAQDLALSGNDTDIAALQAGQASQNNSIATNAAVAATNAVDISNLEAGQIAQDAAVAASQASQDTAIAQNAADIAANDTRDDVQDTQITALETRGEPLGFWDADANTPDLTVAPAKADDFYIVGVSGTTTVNGESSWAVGDFVVSSGGQWVKVTVGSTPTSDAKYKSLVASENLDVLLAGLPENVPFHFHTLFGSVTVSTANASGNGLGIIVDGLAAAGAPTHVIPNGIQGFFTKNAAGDINIHYTTVVPTLFVETRCYSEPGAAVDVDGLLPYLDEINATQLATLPAGAHMRWTAPSDVVLTTLEVARLGAATNTTISWTTSNGDSGSDSASGASANTAINLGSVALSAGDTIDFTLEDITGGQMQLAVAATSTGNGWAALQDYSAFATTNHWSARLIGAEASVEHVVNVYSKNNTEEYKELTNGSLANLAAIPANWTLQSKQDFNNPLLEFFNTEFLPSNTIDVQNYVDQFGVGVKLQDINANNSFMGGVNFDIPDNTFRLKFEIRKENTNKSVLIDLRRGSDNGLLRATVNPTNGAIGVPGTLISRVDNGHSWTYLISYTINQPGEYRFVLSPDFGAGEDCNVFYSFEKFATDAALDVNRERWVATSQDTGGQPAVDGLFFFQRTGLSKTHNSRLVTYNGNSTWTVTTEDNPVEVRLNAATLGATGTAERISYIKETGTTNGNRLPNSTDGVFGNAVPNQVATAIIPPFTTITVEGRSVSSGNNQSLIPGASMEFVEMVGSEEEKVDPFAIGNFLANSYNFGLVIAHEGDSGQTMTITRDGEPVTYSDLLNATDVGNGQVNFAGGANGNFNRRATVVEKIQKPCQKFSISKPITQSFDGQLVLVTRQTGVLATSLDGDYRLAYSRGNATSSQSFNIFKIVNGALVSVYSDGNTAQTVEVERTLSGFKFTKANRVVYETPTECPTPRSENSLFQELSEWTLRSSSGTGMAPVTQSVVHNKLCTVITDTIGGGWHFLENAENIPTELDQEVMVEFARVPGTPTQPATFGLRMNRPGGVRDVVINPDTGEIVRVDPNVEVLSVVRSGEFFQVRLKYTADATYTAFQLYPAYGVTGQAGSNGSQTGEIAISKLEMNYVGSNTGIDVLPEFSGTATKSFSNHFDGRPVTVLTDSLPQNAVVERPFNGGQFSYVEIEYQRDTSASHGLFMRANTPGSGRASVVRLSVVGDVAPTVTSGGGANVADPTVLKTWTTEKTIRHLIRFNEPAGFEHTELEIGPAESNTSLVPTPGQTGSTGILAVTLYEEDPT